MDRERLVKTVSSVWRQIVNPREAKDYARPNANDPEGLPADVFEKEIDAINRRRTKLGLDPVPTPTQEKPVPSVNNALVGLALSGGGIRSATFNLGVLQALQGAGLLEKIDYLSTVSGGGYIGGCLSTTIAAAPQPSDPERGKEVPFAFLHRPGEIEPIAFKHLRDYSRYLAPQGVLANFVYRGCLHAVLLSIW